MPIYDIPSRELIFKLVIVLVMKIDLLELDIWNLRIQLHTNSTNLNSTLEESYSSIYLVESSCITIILAIAFNLHLSKLRITNTY